MRTAPVRMMTNHASRILRIVRGNKQTALIKYVQIDFHRFNAFDEDNNNTLCLGEFDNEDDLTRYYTQIQLYENIRQDNLNNNSKTKQQQ